MNNQQNEMDHTLILSYLKRIGLHQFQEPTLEFLSDISIKHMLTFGWDTIDLYLNREIKLEPDKIMNKFLNELRGGICFELATVLNHILQFLGFKTYLSTAYVHGYNDKVFTFPIDTHVVIIAMLDDKKYLVDVGWDFAEPVLIDNITYFSEGSDQYRLSCEDNNHLLEKLCAGSWRKQYEFSLNETKAAFFEDNLKLITTDPKYISYKKLKIAKLTDTGSISITDKTFFIKNKNEAAKQFLLTNITEAKEILKNYFLINPSFIDQHFNGDLELQ